MKSKRAQTIDDNETWIQGGVVPTLNAFDQGESRATVLIIDGTRVGDVRVYEAGIVQSVISRWGTGGGNVPYVYPIDLRNALRDPEKRDDMNRQGLGLGEDGDPSPTITNVFTPGVAIGFQPTDGFMGASDDGLSVTLKTDAPAVAYSVREDAKADNFSATETDTALALQSLQPSPQSHHAQLFIAEPEPPAVVRRLTPTECERLQGFPDGWTDGQADSHRYKQMGNAVTVNVIEWIGARL